MADHAGASGVRTWSTVDVDAGDAFAYWREEICRTFVPLRPRLLGQRDQPFRGRVDTRTISVATMSRIRAAPQEVVRDPADGDQLEGSWFVNLQIHGTSAVTLADEQRVLRAGDAVLLHAEQHYRMTFGSDFEQACIRLPNWYVRETLGPSDRLHGRVLPASPLTAILRPYVVAAVDQWDADSAAPASMMALAHITALLRTAVSDGATAANVDTDRTVRLLLEIRARHRDPDLDATAVAHHLGISERTLHASLAPTGMTFGQHLRLARLRTVALTRAETGCTVLEAAHGAGFCDVSSYYRARRKLDAGVWR
ncbi:AraC family transcriptional regulator [Nitriliruptor alkaliphilus]|uniref:AraC family transcriptional regulator n=1 Tax=Nitriliruptor alkaliphilus TaxID=427918 RepID=UPI000695DD44|nr:AraC family transcriptional regulator [Nitriliruptor alkaliphilus]